MTTTEPKIWDPRTAREELRGDRVEGALAIPLRYGLQHGGQSLEELRVHPLRAKHVRDLPPGDLTAAHMLELAGQLSVDGLPDEVIDTLQRSDIGAVVSSLQRMCWVITELPGEGFALPDELELPLELELREPLKSADGVVAKVTVRGITGLEIKQVAGQALGFAHLPRLLDKLSDLTPAQVNELGGRDLWCLLGLMQLFFLDVQAAG